MRYTVLLDSLDEVTDRAEHFRLRVVVYRQACFVIPELLMAYLPKSCLSAHKTLNRALCSYVVEHFESLLAALESLEDASIPKYTLPYLYYQFLGLALPDPKVFVHIGVRPRLHKCAQQLYAVAGILVQFVLRESDNRAIKTRVVTCMLRYLVLKLISVESNALPDSLKVGYISLKYSGKGLGDSICLRFGLAEPLNYLLP